MKLYIEKSQIDKKLCIHCEHCSVYAGIGAKDRIMCGLYRDKIDNSEIYYAWQSRSLLGKCGGRKWKVSSNLVICESKEKADHLRSEDWIEGFMPFAREVVKNNQKISITCGGLDSAIERVRKE